MRNTGMELAWGWVAVSGSPLPQSEHLSEHLVYLETQFLKVKNWHLQACLVTCSSLSVTGLPMEKYLSQEQCRTRKGEPKAAGQGRSSVLKVPIVRAWGPESDLQCPWKSQSLHHTSVIPALGWRVWRQAYSLVELVSYRFSERPGLNEIRWRMIKV